MTTQFQ